MGKEEKSKIHLLKSSQSSKCARQKIGTLPRAIWIKSTKRYDTKEIVGINFVHMKHGGSRWGEIVDQKNIPISVWPEDVYLQDTVY